ncbi:redoxin domain-containing protein [Histidinibacterium aquaticum]|uniref:Alkyl hydroperoxide reductase C n=1 Tax=Histidinibacterium aquaticum TaxID=2613962 RepID=A0A5J5GQP6_9RHOB|nr:redoxin domain-containing protein [Histidinibacterium aquaticum]KAA9009894.1 redoxin domain-containing protein [Histidinibacterium aquaticum]
MKHSIFKESVHRNFAEVPRAYKRTVSWIPRIGDFVPNFGAETTYGPVNFHTYAEGAWTVLFTHPAAFTPVCTTELAMLATISADLRRRGAKVMGLSTGTLQAQRDWQADIAQIFGRRIDFPVICDPDGTLVELFGALHPASDCANAPVRKTVIIDPSLRIRAISEYPAGVGRSSEEIIRMLDALRTVEEHNVVTGADWQLGDDCFEPRG